MRTRARSQIKAVFGPLAPPIGTDTTIEFGGAAVRRSLITSDAKRSKDGLVDRKVLKLETPALPGWVVKGPP